MRSNKKSIAIDMDYVIADVETQFINWYERDYGVKILKDNLKGKPEGEAFPDKGAIRKFCFTKGFFSEIPVMAGSQEVVKSLMENFDVFIVSAAMEFPQSLIEKHKWLHENFPFISWRNIIFCGDKSIIGTDYLIDDHLKNLDFCRGKAIMYSASHNINFNHHLRVHNWDEVYAFFKAELSNSEN